MKRNPFAKYLGKEDVLQNQVMRANEGKRTPFEQYKMKYLGTKPGIPDIMIFEPNETKNGLAIELKAGYNKPTPNQKKWLKELENNNWVAVWSNNLDECIEIIDKYFNNK
jgi:hypothetical protein